MRPTCLHGPPPLASSTMRRQRTSRARVRPGAFALAAAIAVLGLVSLVDAESTRVAGNVFKVDPEKHEVTIVDAGRRHVLAYSDATVIRAGREDRTIADLKRGDRVVVTLATDDPGRAARIAVAGPGSGESGGGGDVPAFAPGLNARTRPR